MEKNIKNIRKSSSTKIIIVSDDKTILEKDIKDLYSDFEELKIISSPPNTVKYCIATCIFSILFVVQKSLKSSLNDLSNIIIVICIPFFKNQFYNNKYHIWINHKFL